MAWEVSIRGSWLKGATDAINARATHFRSKWLAYNANGPWLNTLGQWNVRIRGHHLRIRRRTRPITGTSAAQQLPAHPCVDARQVRTVILLQPWLCKSASVSGARVYSLGLGAAVTNPRPPRTEGGGVADTSTFLRWSPAYSCLKGPHGFAALAPDGFRASPSQPHPG